MENSLVKAVVNEKGEIVSFILKESGREFAADAMNRFHLYKDVPRLFDAWDIDSNYIDQEIEAAKNVAVSMEADGLEGVLKDQQFHLYTVYPSGGRQPKNRV